tara:strand:- start:95 stop:295 length:201 start_codon:yes stop_codon:yes gene_type:complete
MENPFKKLNEPLKEVPKELRKKVMDDIAAFKLFSDIAGVFSSNYASVVESFFIKREKKRNEDNKSK